MLARFTSRVALAGVALTLALVLLAASPPTASASGCFYLPANTLAKALGYEHAASYLDDAPNPEPHVRAVFSLCRAYAWNGSLPKSKAEIQQKLASGEGVGVVMKTEEANSSDTPEELELWEEDYNHAVVAALKGSNAASAATGGKSFTLPTFGAEFDHCVTIGSGTHRGAGGIWYDEKSHAYMTLGLTARAPHIEAALKKLAAKAVPSFGL